MIKLRIKIIADDICQFLARYWCKAKLKLMNGYFVKKYLFIFIVGFLLSSSISAQSNSLSAKYNLRLLGANIGEFLITQTETNGNLSIDAITDLKLNLLFSYHIKYIQKTVYEKGVLKSSTVQTYKNGKLNSSTELNQEKDNYLLIADGDTTIINDSITFSGSLLYFNEPCGIKQLYKERTAEMQQITQLNDYTYVINDKKDRELNRYFYKGGNLEYASMRHALGTIELKKVRKE